MGIYPPNSIFQRENEFFFKILFRFFYPVFIGKINGHNAFANCTNQDQFSLVDWIAILRMKTYNEDDRQNQLECSMGKDCIRKGFGNTGSLNDRLVMWNHVRFRIR